MKCMLIKPRALMAFAIVWRGFPEMLSKFRDIITKTPDTQLCRVGNPNK